AGNVTPGDAPGFPVTISQPGSYRLSSNLDVPSHGLGIDIQADDVSIDLNGFRIRGNAMSGRAIAAGAAPIPSSGFKGIVVRNGTISNFDTGIDFSEVDFFTHLDLPNSATESVIEHISVHDMAGEGIDAGPNSTVAWNTVSNCGTR